MKRSTVLLTIVTCVVLSPHASAQHWFPIVCRDNHTQTVETMPGQFVALNGRCYNVAKTCSPLVLQGVGFFFTTILTVVLFRSHTGENEWDSVGWGYKTFGASTAVIAKQLWDQLNLCLTTALLYPDI